MVNNQTKKCYVLWMETHSGGISFEPVAFTSAAAAITEGERLKEKRTIKDYNYSIVEAPDIGATVQPKNFQRTGLTLNGHQPTIQL